MRAPSWIAIRPTPPIPTIAVTAVNTISAQVPAMLGPTAIGVADLAGLAGVADLAGAAGLAGVASVAGAASVADVGATKEENVDAHSSGRR